MRQDYCVLALSAVMASANSTLGQVVQLPEMHSFWSTGSVLVPDSGGDPLGSIRRARSSNISRGMPGWGPLGRNASRASALPGGGVLVHAAITDHGELDEHILSEARARRGASGIALPDDEPRIFAARDAPALESVAEIKRRLAAEDALLESEAERDFAKASEYEKQGDYSLACNYYRVTWSKSKGQLRQKAAERLAKLSSRASTKK